MSRENSPIPFPNQVTLMIATEDGMAYSFVKVDREMLEEEEIAASSIRQALERLDERLAELTRGGRRMPIGEPWIDPDTLRKKPLWAS